jgi:hypothetical protein
VSVPVLRAALMCVVAGLAACTPAEPEVVPPAPAAPAPAVQAAATPADLSRFGELRIGAPFGKAPGDSAFVSAGMRELMEGDCEYYDQGSLPESMSMMVLGDRIARFEVDLEQDPGVALDAPPAGAPALPFGLWTGMRVAEANKRLPAGVVTSPHAYNSPDGDYLTWTDKASKLAIRLETLNGVVTAIYWGQPDAVELIEGCA